MPRTRKWSELEARLKERDSVWAAGLEDRVREMAEYSERCERTLAEIRRAREKTQVEVASALRIGQGQISRLEKQTDLFLSTLEKYVEALGGRLELTAVFGEERYPLRIGDLAGDETAPAAEAEAELQSAAG